MRRLQKRKVFLEPLVVGALANYSFGKQYFAFNPDNYPYSYYKFPTALSAAVLVGSRVGTTFKPNQILKGIAVYYEL